MIRNQSGNVIFYILIAVALLAALSFTVSQSGRGSVSNVSLEQSKLFATEIIEYGNNVAMAVSQLRLRGVSADEVSFENTVVAGYTNAACTEADCLIFDIEGGGLTFQSPPPNANDGTDWVYTTNGIDEIGSTRIDLVMILQNIDQTVCQQINQKLHNTTTIPEENASVSLTKFTGAYVGAVSISTTPSTALKSAYCFEGDNSLPADTYHYYQVLIAR